MKDQPNDLYDDIEAFLAVKLPSFDETVSSPDDIADRLDTYARVIKDADIYEADLIRICKSLNKQLKQLREMRTLSVERFTKAQEEFNKTINTIIEE